MLTFFFSPNFSIVVPLRLGDDDGLLLLLLLLLLLSCGEERPEAAHLGKAGLDVLEVSLDAVLEAGDVLLPDVELDLADGVLEGLFERLRNGETATKTKCFDSTTKVPAVLQLPGPLLLLLLRPWRRRRP